MVTITKDNPILIGRSDTGSYVVATASSPYFCFEGSSEAEVKSCARRALAFAGSISPPASVPDRTLTFRSVIAEKYLRSQDLVEA